MAKPTLDRDAQTTAGLRGKRRDLPRRAEQKAMILKSEKCLSGKEFNRNYAAEITGIYGEAAAYLLLGMANDGLLCTRKVPQGSKTFIFYSRKPTNLLCVAWRTLTDFEIGISA